jgi:hypothetical protein
MEPLHCPLHDAGGGVPFESVLNCSHFVALSRREGRTGLRCEIDLTLEVREEPESSQRVH